MPVSKKLKGKLYYEEAFDNSSLRGNACFRYGYCRFRRKL